MGDSPVLSVVVSVYNEVEGIRDAYEKMTSVLQQMQETYELVFVDDGSTDGTGGILRPIAESDANVRLVSFSKNFGHEAAMLAGIDYSRGDAVICLDSDLQHPPAMIPDMVARWHDGFDVVNMVRTDRADASRLQKNNSRLFYHFTNLISDVKLAENASDFFLISKRVAAVLKTDFRERTRFLRGIVQLVGFSKTTLEYKAQERKSGHSKYSFFKLMKLSFSAISSFSKAPLRLGIFTGIVFGLISLILIAYSLVMWIFDTPVSGYTTLVVFMAQYAPLRGS